MSEARILWRRVSRGLYLIGFGALFLLNSLGLLPWSFWIEAGTWWPVILVAVGIRLIFERSRVPAAILLSPILVLGTLALVAWSGPWTIPYGMVPLRAERPAALTEWTLDARLATTLIDIEARPLPEEILLDGVGSSDEEGWFEVVHSSGSRHVRLRSRDRRWSFIPAWRGRGRCEVGVTQDLPIFFDGRLAFTEGGIDLAAAPLSEMSLTGAFNDLEVRLGAPASDVRLRFRGAFNRLELIVPESVPVRIESDGLLNRVDRRSESGTQGPGYRLRVDGTLNHITVRSSP